MKRTNIAAITIPIIISLVLFIGILQTGAFSIAQAHETNEVLIPSTEVPLTAELPEVEETILEPVEPFMIPTQTASGINVSGEMDSIIDYSNTGDGYVMVSYYGTTDRNIIVIINESNSNLHIFNVTPGQWEVFSLTSGNGVYTIQVGLQIEGNDYEIINSVDFTVNLNDSLSPFLQSNIKVSYNTDSAVTLKARELTMYTTDTASKVDIIYDFVVNNIVFDRDFANKVSSGEIESYSPDPERTLSSGKGVCSDFASLIVAMLRSQGVPAQMVYGNAEGIFHAWVNVYIDGNWTLLDPTHAANGISIEQIQSQNYQAMYIY